MLVVTFYSYKGGVGRTMALVNCGVELARRGRKVLLIDFDLQAPGLSTFSVLGVGSNAQGIADFIHEFLNTNQSPSATDYVSFSPTIDFHDGEVAVMSAGSRAGKSTKQPIEIDWNELYNHRDGFLLLEDLKEQWRTVIEPDYVLIDCQSGRSDAGSICTRQLADLVLLFYQPNEENLQGIQRTVADIRLQSEEQDDKAIQLSFVMSNVPDLDDEDTALNKTLRQFQSFMQPNERLITIHRNNSISLLSKAVFALDRPQSRLAEEYRNLADMIEARHTALQSY